ncbi:MAG: pirin-like C-terminal cupin domain-containing protein [Flavobacteriales bacterium]
MAIWNIKLDAGARYLLPCRHGGDQPEHLLLRRRPDAPERAGAGTLPPGRGEGGPAILLTAGDKPCSILVLQGQPINEPVVQHGPFVMNMREEIQQALRTTGHPVRWLALERSWTRFTTPGGRFAVYLGWA